MAACHFTILGSLTQELTDAQIDLLIAQFARHAAGDSAAGMLRTLRLPPSAGGPTPFGGVSLRTRSCTIRARGPIMPPTTCHPDRRIP